MTMLLDGRLRDLATQTHLLETKVSSLGWMAGAGAQTLKSMTRAQAHLMLAEFDLLDDPEYERIDNIENVQVGDIACTTEGNHFRVIDLKPDPLGDMLLRIRISEIDGEYCIDSDDFAYALRRKPKLPDHDGLWWDKDNALWSVAISGLDNSKLVALLIGDPESPVTGSVWSDLNSKHVTSQAPFRPAKAVEA